MNGGNFEVNNVGRDRWIHRLRRDRYVAYCKHYSSCNMASKPVYHMLREVVL